MAEILGSGIHPFVADMLECTEAMLNPDESGEVQRAAVLLCSRLVKTLGKEGIMQNQERMSKIYNRLKIAVRNNVDELTRVHAISALDDLGQIMLKFIFPQQRSPQLNVVV